MQTKLTLRLERKLIEQAKIHANQQGKSLSQIVADYFETFNKTKDKNQLAPITSSLLGVLHESKSDEEDYKKHLEEKYL